MKNKTLEIHKVKRCKECHFATEITRHLKHWGWACNHQKVMEGTDLIYGKMHQIEKKKPAWCPLKEGE